MIPGSQQISNAASCQRAGEQGYPTTCLVSCVKSAWSFTQCKASAQGYLPEARVKVAGVTSCVSEKRTDVAGAKVAGVKIAGQKCLVFLETAILRNMES